MSRPALVATDLDGTLLDPSGQVTPFTRDVLVRLWDSGIETLFVTARPPRWIDDLADAVGGHGYAICANGAFLYDVHARRVVERHVMALDEAVRIAEDVRARIPGVGFALEHADGAHVERAYGVAGGPPPAGLTVGPIEDAPTDGVGKLLARVPAPGVLEGAGPSIDLQGRAAAGSAFVDEVRRIVGDRAAVHYSGVRGLAEIGPAGVSKATALARWCAGHDIAAADVWAFGDMPNDIPMLTWAGRSFAMAGAPDPVRDAATDACGGNDADGVARCLVRLLGL